ncbi:MAG TPA: TonB-dependent receptor [Candidatus Eisenbacteria bacterium]|nr:TonB-dependent receptor [Candidatus Eisenbacteria bacterium]
MNSVFRGGCILGLLLSLAGFRLPAQQSLPNSSHSSATPAYQITGTARSGKTPLPGATVTASNTLTGKKYSVVTDAEGRFALVGIARGRYAVRIEFMGFGLFSQDVLVNPENPAGKIEAELILASRQQEQATSATSSLTAGRGFQSLAMDGALSSLAGEGGGFGGGTNGSGNQGGADLSSLPLNGAGAEGPTESISISGTQGRTQDFGAGSEEEIQERIQEFRERVQREGGNPFGGGPGQGPGGPGGAGGGSGGGPIMIGRLGGRGFNVNQPHGVFYFSDDNAGLDATPYSLSGFPAAKSSYNQAHFGANVGGPLNIPKLFHGGNKWFFFAGWNASRGDTPYDSFSRVPTQDERTGNFAGATYNDGTPVQLFDPATGQPYQYNGVLNAIAPTLFSSASEYLLHFIPLPNIPTTAEGQNFHYVTSAENSSDAVIARLVHNLGSSSGPFMRPSGGGRGGGRRNQNNINFGLNWTRSNTNLVNSFPSLAGGTSIQGLNASAGWIYGKNRTINILRVNYNHYHLSTTNLYSNFADVAGPGGAGINGISNDPFDWGLPGISFTSFGGLSDPSPRRSLNQTYTISDTLSRNHGKHNFRFGGDYRRILQSFRASRNAEGSFVFTGYATSDYLAGSTQAVPDTGYDFADFLLGYPQQTSLQFGATSYDFRANAFDLFAQDDWRILASLSINLGLRYEYNGPYTEAQDRIANLVVGPQYASGVPIVPTGAVLPPGSPTPLFSSQPSLINPDRNNVAPRIGIAWKPWQKTVVRAGYGINYNLAQYSTVIQNFAFQPPFASTATNSTDVAGLTGPTPLTIVDGFPEASPSTVTNNFAVDPDYALGYVQIWNLDVQRELHGNVMLNIGYNGAKGTRLDTDRAIVASGNQPFVYETSEGNSILHAASVRVRKRMSNGLGIGAQYVFSKSLDDASSIGSGGVVVVQNPFDLPADRGLSSFNQTHKFTGNWIYDLPFGENHRFAQKGFWMHALSNWQWSGSFTIASGMYFTPNVLGGSLDIERGVTGSLRANVISGQPISISNPTALHWFNTAAFCAPGPDCTNAAGSSYGDAARNLVEGPGSVIFNMSINRTIPIKETRSLDLRLSANNVFNHVNYSSINTAVNSLTFGEVTSVGGMRRVTVQARFRF